MRRMLTKVPDASLSQPTVTCTYNASGQRATMNDASGETVYTYDVRNRLATKQTPFGTLTYTYDNASNLLTTRSSNANGVSVDYTYDVLNRLGYVDPSGHSAFMDKLVSLSISAIVSTMSVIGRVLPAVYVLASRFAYWFFENQMKIDFWLHASEAALIFMQYSSNLILNNEEAIDIQDGNPGAWVERKVGANATGYELIDDYRDGNAMSIKTNQQDMPRLLRLIQNEAETLGNRNSDFQPGNQYPGLKPLPIADVKSRTVMVIIPETNAGFLRDPSFIAAVKQIQRTTRTIVNVVPLRGWRK
jgi:YD repeat-containing protein